MATKRNIKSKSKARLVDMSPPEPKPAFNPNRDGAVTEEWHEFLGDADRFTWRTVRDKRGRLIDFSLTQWHWVGPDEDDWAEIVRVDTKHDEIHRHSFRADGSLFARRKYADIAGYTDLEEDVQRPVEVRGGSHFYFLMMVKRRPWSRCWG